MREIMEFIIHFGRVACSIQNFMLFVFLYFKGNFKWFSTLNNLLKTIRNEITRHIHTQRDTHTLGEREKIVKSCNRIQNNENKNKQNGIFELRMV